MRARAGAVPLALALCSVAPCVLANGRYPAAGQLVVDPGDPARLVLRATYGVVESADSGQTWSWICEPSIGFSGVEDPPIGVTSGATIAGLSTGLSASRDRGCAWGMVAGALGTRRIIDVAVERATPSHAVALSVTYSPKKAHDVYESLDDAQTWTQAGVSLPGELTLLVTLDVAPSDPQRLYASGSSGNPTDGAFARSDDRGATWSLYSLGTGADIPYIAAVDPANADRVYVRVSATNGDRLLVTDDGGKTWSQAWTGAGQMLGCALSPDGTRLAVGGPQAGLFVASTVGEGFTFKKASSVGVRCLTWATAGLYGCADEVTDGFTLGLSSDEGATFAPLYHLADLGLLACDPGTTTGTLCPAAWPALQQRLSGADAGPEGADASSDAAADDASTDAATEADAAVPAAGGPPAESSSGCATRPTRPGSALALALALVALVLGPARSRR